MERSTQWYGTWSAQQAKSTGWDSSSIEVRAGGETLLALSEDQATDFRHVRLVAGLQRQWTVGRVYNRFVPDLRLTRIYPGDGGLG